MNWLQSQQAETSRLLAKTSLPRKLLRWLLEVHRIQVGSRVLDVGCGAGDLVCFLNHLGIEATGIDESAEKIQTARKTSTQRTFGTGCVGQSDQLDENYFDLVVVRDSDVHAGSMLSDETMQATAHLLSCLKPGGNLVFLQSLQTLPRSDLTGHSAECYLRHLSQFPGSLESSEFPGRTISLESWNLIFRRRPSSHFLTVTLRTPSESIPRTQWLKLANVNGRSIAKSCCAWSMKQFSQPANLRKAA